jgi:aryl-alcohol dehydrogenase-like predicted oxidoreductase
MAGALGLTVAAWSPLADGILTGKFTGTAPARQPSRIDPVTVSEHQHAVAAAVKQAAADLGATPPRSPSPGPGTGRRPSAPSSAPGA